MNAYNPDSWLDILGLVIIALAFVAAAAIPALIAARRSKSLHADMADVKDQVKNNHATNLRDDIDGLARQIEGVREHQWEQSRDIAGIRTDIGGLRGEIRDERADRIAADDRLNEHIKLEVTRTPSTSAEDG